MRGKCGKMWGSYRQQDAHELLVALLERLQGEVLASQLGCAAGRGWERVVWVWVWTSYRGRRSPCRCCASCNRPPCFMHAPQLAMQAEGVSKLRGKLCPSTLEHSLHPPLTACYMHAPQLAMQPLTGAGRALAPVPTLPVSQVQQLCPATRCFSGCLQHTLTCSACGHVTKVSTACSTAVCAAALLLMRINISTHLFCSFSLYLFATTVPDSFHCPGCTWSLSLILTLYTS